jgi:glycosyltransferase involved in cell wall biosynthesis
MKNRVVLVNQSTGYLMVDIVNAFAQKYDEVVLLAGGIGEMDRPLCDKVKVDRVCVYDRSSTIKRLRTWLKCYWQIKKKIRNDYKNYEVVYVTNPPMSYFTALHTETPFSIVVYDIYPDALKNIGIKPTNPIYKIWTKRNKKIFARAKKVVVLSEGMAKVLSQYMPQEDITVIPNWAGSDNFAPLPKKENAFAKEHGLEDKFVVMYSGNMGFTHSVDVLVDVAEKVKNNDKIHFLLVGDGQKRPIIENRIKESGLTNCTVLGWQPVEVLPQSFACADIGVITLNEDSAAVSVPSKTYNLLAVGAPLLCICPQESEMTSLVKKYENGRCFQASQVNEMTEFILQVASDEGLQKKLSDNSLKASLDFSYHNAEKYL